MSTATTTATTTRPQLLSGTQATMLIAEREINAQLRSKSFLISTAVLLVGVLAAVILPSVIGGFFSSDTTVAVRDGQIAAALAGVDGIEVTEVQDGSDQTIRDMVADGTVDAALVSDTAADNPLGVRVVALESAPDDLMSALAVTPPVELLDEPSTDHGMRYLISLVFGLVFMMASMTFGSTIAQNAVQEKQSRIVEILLSTVSPRALLAGKVIGNTVLAVGQTAAIAVVAVLGLVITDQDDLLGMLGAPVAWFVVFFLVGFLLLAAMFAAAASMVSRMEDTGSVLTPVMWLIMVPYFVVIFFNDNSLVMTIASYVPFSAPVAMPVRLFVGEASWWEPLLSLVLLAATAGLVIVLGAKIYERSILRTGRRVKLGEALRGRD